MRISFIVVMLAAAALTQQQPGHAQQAQAPALPVAPYDEVVGWGPAGVGNFAWEPAGMDVDADGNIYLLRRSEPNLVIVDRDGKNMRTMTTPPLVWAHMMSIDRQGNLWITDASVGAPPGSAGKTHVLRNQAALDAHKGYQVFKLSPQGKVLLTLGTEGEPGEDATHFISPTAVVTAPDGSIFVSDGHERGTGRMLKFKADGTFVKTWGKPGAGPGEFSACHGLVMDSRGRLLVADRYNNRVQVFDQDGNFIEQFTGFGSPAGIAVAPDDTLFTADPAKSIVFVGSAKTGTVSAMIPNVLSEPMAIDKQGSIYFGDTIKKTWRKFSPRK